MRTLICKSFAEDAADNTSKAKIDKETGKIISGGDIPHIKHKFSIKADFADRTLGMTDSAWEEANNNLQPGSFADFDFGKQQSVITLNTNHTIDNASAAAYMFADESLYSFVSDAGMTLGNDSSDDNDEDMAEAEEEKHSQVVMPPGEISRIYRWSVYGKVRQLG